MSRTRTPARDKTLREYQRLVAMSVRLEVDIEDLDKERAELVVRRDELEAKIADMTEVIVGWERDADQTS